MTLWNDIIIGICLLLLGWLVWKEFRRTNRLRLIARIAASAIAVISLACLALPPSYWKTQRSASSGKEAVLLTEGYDPDSLRQFLQKAQTEGVTGDIKVFGEDSVISEARAGAALFDKLSKLHVFGYGLTGKEWASLHPPPLTFHLSSPPTGILSVIWQQKLISGEKLRIQGSLSLPPGRPAKLLLTGMGMSLDSVVIGPGTKGPRIPGSDTFRNRNASGLNTKGGASPGSGSSRSKNASGLDSSPTVASAGRTDFELNTIPPQSGQSIFRLYVLSGIDTGSAISSGANAPHMDTLEQEVLPIEVLPAPKLRILLLAASPDFENTFLVNWLARNGHAVATRTLISKDKSDKAFLNMPEVALEPLTAAVLDKFDLVIADAEVLQSGKPSEGASLRRQIAEKGLGLIIKADSLATGSSNGTSPRTSSSNAPFYKDLFRVEAARDSTRRLYIKETPGTQPLLRDSSSRILVSRGLYGSGKLVFTTLDGTYSRMLAGARDQYLAYWSLVLEAAVRSAEPEEDWQFIPQLPRVNEPVEAQLQTTRSGLPQGQFAAIGTRTDSGNATPPAVSVYLTQSPLLPFQWEGRYWPAEAGWQSAATLQGYAHWWYAWSAEDWPGIRRMQRVEETRAYITRQAPIPTDLPFIPSHTDSQRVPVPLAWFYGLFIISCLFLWVERKI